MCIRDRDYANEIAETICRKLEDKQRKTEVQTLYQEAIKFATYKHQEKRQKVKGTKLPYIVHLSNVAMEIFMAAQNTKDFNLIYAIQTALLHDTIEDTETTFDELKDSFGEDIAIALDAAASEFWDETKQRYVFKKSDKKEFDSNGMIGFWKDWCSKYPILSIEDGIHEDEWTGWTNLTKELGNKVQIVGDDFFVTNVDRLQKGIDTDAANSILIKVNQIGTLSETIDAIQLANRNAYTSIISHRSGETEDTFISDLSVATNVGQIKTGSASRSERIAKYNQLIRIEEELGDMVVFGGRNVFYSIR